MNAIFSRLSVALVFSSSSCLTRVSKSEKGPDVVWVDASRDWDVEPEVLFEVIVSLGLDIWILSRALWSWKAAELGGLTGKGAGRERGDGSLICWRNWASSSSSWWIVACSFRRSLFSLLRFTKIWSTWCWTAWRYWNCFMLASGKVWTSSFVCSSACFEFILSWLTWLANRCSCSETVGLLESGEVLGLLVGIVRSFTFCEVDASISVNNSGRYIENIRERFFGLNMGACGFTVIRQAVLR